MCSPQRGRLTPSGGAHQPAATLLPAAHSLHDGLEGFQPLTGWLLGQTPASPPPPKEEDEDVTEPGEGWRSGTLAPQQQPEHVLGGAEGFICIS